MSFFAIIPIALANASLLPPPPPGPPLPERGQFVCDLKDDTGEATHITGQLGFFEVYGNESPKPKVTLKSDKHPNLTGDFLATWGFHGADLQASSLMGGVQLMFDGWHRKFATITAAFDEFPMPVGFPQFGVTPIQRMPKGTSVLLAGFCHLTLYNKDGKLME